jgi:hypothetical protein
LNNTLKTQITDIEIEIIQLKRKNSYPKTDWSLCNIQILGADPSVDGSQSPLVLRHPFLDQNSEITRRDV